MPTPRDSAAYPASFLVALHRALETGAVEIPCPPSDGVNPDALRLQFYGLLSALAREGKPEMKEMLTIITRKDPPLMRIEWRDTARMGSLVARYLETPSNGSRLFGEGEK